MMGRIRERRRRLRRDAGRRGREDVAVQRRRTRSFWLLSKVEGGRLRVLTVDLGGGLRGLPVFSSAEETRTYLDSGPGRDGWRVRETARGEIASVLLGPCAGVGRVLLDPTPDLTGPELSELVGVGTGTFLDAEVSKQPG